MAFNVRAIQSVGSVSNFPRSFNSDDSRCCYFHGRLWHVRIFLLPALTESRRRSAADQPPISRRSAADQPTSTRPPPGRRPAVALPSPGRRPIVARPSSSSIGRLPSPNRRNWILHNAVPLAAYLQQSSCFSLFKSADWIAVARFIDSMRQLLMLRAGNRLIGAFIEFHRLEKPI